MTFEYSKHHDENKLPEFGEYVVIEQRRFYCENEFYIHKVVTTSQSNTWVDVPVQTPATETIHDEIVDVVWCICCGVMENQVRKYRVEDVKIVDVHYSAVYRLSAEIERLRAALSIAGHYLKSMDFEDEKVVREALKGGGDE